MSQEKSKLEEDRDLEALESILWYMLSAYIDNEELIDKYIESCRPNLRYIAKMLSALPADTDKDWALRYALLQLAKSICLNLYDLEHVLFWTAGAINTKWVWNEIQTIKRILEQLKINSTKAGIIRTPLDAPFDFLVYYEGTLYIIEITQSDKTIKDIIKKLSDKERETFCRKPNVKIVLHRSGQLIIEDFKKYC